MAHSPIPTHKIADCPLAERQWAATTIQQVPLMGAFDAPARQWLIDRALEGFEVDAYQHRDGEWVLWIRTSDPADEMRWPPHEWAIAWRAVTQSQPGGGEAVAALSIGPLLALAIAPAWHAHPVSPLFPLALLAVYGVALVAWRPWRRRKVAS